MDRKTKRLVETARLMVTRLLAVAGDKPADHVLKSDAQTLRNTANVIFGLGAMVEQLAQERDALQTKLQRIADLQVRGANHAIATGNWKDIVEEMQAIALERVGDEPSKTPR